MNNRNLYQKDPAKWKLVNEGVASVNDDKTEKALKVLRYELETFVCNGQYEKGMSDILNIYLKNINQEQQPAVWVSGFYGSGKSHLVKMLRALWTDTVFDDGAAARGIVNLPKGIKDQFQELSIQAKKHGGLHAASGTLGAGSSSSVRLALLSIIFKSAGLPEQYPFARFVMWLKKEGIEAQVRDYIESKGYKWEEELENLYVAEGLHEALVQVKPNLYSSTVACVETLNNLYPFVYDVSSDDMVKAIRNALTKGGKFPLTLIVLDEVQQYIGGSAERSIEVQEMVEAVSKNLGSKLLFIGTGQTAVTGTANLAKLQARFTVPVELSDNDVDAVIRQMVLAKKPEAKKSIEELMQINIGEISRHLAGTTIGHRKEDVPYFYQDYPILPVRRRFWEKTLRVIDSTGTDSQVRNQLSLIFKAVKENMELPVGHVVPADFLLFDVLERINQTRGIPSKAYRLIKTWVEGSEEERIKARACGLVFLINKLVSKNREIGLKATVDVIADLMVEDISAGSSNLRSKLPSLLDKCDLLMKIGDEYRIQTDESAAWTDDFLNHKSTLSNETHRIETEREDRIRKKFGEIVGKLSLPHGISKVPRNISSCFESSAPADASQRIYIWVRNGWNIDENSVRADAHQAGNQSPTVFVFIPRRSSDELCQQIIDYKSAFAVLEQRGESDTPEGKEARAAMETIKRTAEGKIKELLEETFSGARVFQGGGNEIIGSKLQEMILEAATNSLQRLYPEFHIADHHGWTKVYENAKKGAPDALKSVNDNGEPSKNPVCKALLGFIAGGKRGADIRNQFDSSPYGWSQDSIDGALQTLLVAGMVRAEGERGQLLDPKELERKNIGKVMFKVESATVTAAQRIQIRKLLQKVGISVKQGEELIYIPQFIQKLKELSDEAGGEAPKPSRPDTSFIDDIRLIAGNEQLIALYNLREDIDSKIDTWTKTAEHIKKNWTNWIVLKRLITHGSNLPDVEALLHQVNTIEQQRQLLEEPDLVLPLITSLTQILRDELNKLNNEYNACEKEGLKRLEEDKNWHQLEQEQRYELMSSQLLNEAARPKIEVQSTNDILNTLDKCSLSGFADRVAALPARFEKVATSAAELCEPETQFIQVPRRALKTEDEIEDWVNDVKKQLKKALKNGPIQIR